MQAPSVYCTSLQSTQPPAAAARCAPIATSRLVQNGQCAECDDNRVAEMNMPTSACVNNPDAPWWDWQVALSRSGHDAGVCPFCNKANYSVIYRAKTTAQRAAERREREHVEQAVLHARQVGLLGRFASSCSVQPWPSANDCQLGYSTDLLQWCRRRSGAQSTAGASTQPVHRRPCRRSRCETWVCSYTPVFFALHGHKALCMARKRAVCTISPHIGAALYARACWRRSGHAPRRKRSGTCRAGRSGGARPWLAQRRPPRPAGKRTTRTSRSSW